MGTEILRPQNCLIERIRVPPAAFSRRRSYNNYSNYYNNHAATFRSYRKPATRADHRKRVVVGSNQPEASVSKRTSVDDSRMARSSGYAMEKVTILLRGESLDSKLRFDSCSVAEKSDVYAGSAFAMSPSPSALPLPSFSTKKQASAVVDDSATRDLRRLLGLD